MTDIDRRIELLRAANLILDDDPSQDVIDRLYSLTEDEVKHLIKICRKISSPIRDKSQPSMKYYENGFQLRK